MLWTIQKRRQEERRYRFRIEPFSRDASQFPEDWQCIFCGCKTCPNPENSRLLQNRNGNSLNIVNVCFMESKADANRGGRC